MMLDLRARAFVLAVIFAAGGVALFGQSHKGVTLRGTIYTQGDPENCSFFTDPIDDSLSVNISAAPGEYLCDYLRGSETHVVTITITPEPK